MIEYVKERAKLCDLTKAVRAWGRKVEISEVAVVYMAVNACAQYHTQHACTYTYIGSYYFLDGSSRVKETMENTTEQVN